MEDESNFARLHGDKEESSYDAIVVGSGYGGSVAACRMSMAGIKVCLIEKGRKWEAKDFPTDSMKIMSAVRLESKNLKISFGKCDSLLQVYDQDDSLAAVACGLGGGSLVNAGVMMSTPMRTRRNTKWPKEWERHWDSCEASAAAMLGIQNVPVKFDVAKIMSEIVDGDIDERKETSVKLSMHFDLEDGPPVKLQQMGTCLACGNCLAGCPYNAKSSTDKNYLLLATKAGCVVKTSCQVQYVVKNPYESQQECRISRRQRRWFVYLNEMDYVTSDFVILSAGVFGTTEMLFQSRMRGLKLSEALGSGFSCNGNNVAYLARSPVHLNAYGLGRKDILKTPFAGRPGPSISSSHTYSSGFTIQSAVLPTAYPSLLLKGITTYKWPNGYWFFHGIIDKLKDVMGLRSSHAMVLNAMGYDESDGNIVLEKDTNKIRFTPPHDPMLPRKVEAFQKLTKKLGGILYMSRYRSTSVHLLGGCNVSSDPLHGVCNPNGQVFDPSTPNTVHPGLYVCDASIIPCSVGINPSLTITAAAEHVSKHLVPDVLHYKAKQGVDFLVEQIDQTPIFYKNSENSQRSIVSIKETMKGFVGGMPCTAYLILKMNFKNQKELGKWDGTNEKSSPTLRGRVGGYILFSTIEKDRLHIINGDFNLCEIDNRTPYTQYMSYNFLLMASSGSKYILKGRKIMNPFLLGLNAWRETTTLHVTFKKLSGEKLRDDRTYLKGKLRISLTDVVKSLLGLEGNCRGKFIRLLSQALLRTYILQTPRKNYMDHALSDSHSKPYLSRTLHEIRTEDGYIISCVQWKCDETPLGCKVRQKYPVLLLNGYSTESYWLPTEPIDLVRTILEEGHETWLLQPRLHPLNPANNFAIDHIGKFDIPAVIYKILDFNGKNIKLHVVAHCVGGLAVHIALMGGYISADLLASLSCTNSSMFFKLDALSRVKMWLPLVPVSMAILGKNKTLPLLDPHKASLQQQLLKLIARFIPRYERCICDECNIFSGLFGNTFWHENLTPTMHHWLNKKSTTMIPMAAFPHLRKICNSGFIVDRNGNNSYLIHPERMALPTLYISGGRSILVTPETSFLANKYMKLHQPGFLHERVVVDGLGHSDLLIGKKSHKKVFPHILNHIRLTEMGETVGKKYSEVAVKWGDDPHAPYGGFGSPLLITFLISLGLLLCLLLVQF